MVVVYIRDRFCLGREARRDMKMMARMRDFMVRIASSAYV